MMLTCFWSAPLAPPSRDEILRTSTCRRNPSPTQTPLAASLPLAASRRDEDSVRHRAVEVGLFDVDEHQLHPLTIRGTMLHRHPVEQQRSFSRFCLKSRATNLHLTSCSALAPPVHVNPPGGDGILTHRLQALGDARIDKGMFFIS